MTSPVGTGGRLRWALIGSGWMTSRMAEAIEASSEDQIVAVISRDDERGARFADEHHCSAVFRDLGACLEGARPDAVYVGSPNALHATHTAQALASGVHVLCDKPLALDTADAEALRDTARTRQLRLGVNLQTRHHPTARWLREALAGGLVGAVDVIDVHLGFGPEDLVGWRAEPDLAGAGSLHNLGAHALDTLLFLAGAAPRSVSALMNPPGAALDRTARVLVRFDGGIIGCVAVSQAQTGDDVRIDVRGPGGRVTWDGWLAPYRSGPVTTTTAAGIESVEASAPDAYARVIGAFGDAVRSGRDPDPDPETAVALVRLSEAVERSAREGRTIAIDTAGGPLVRDDKGRPDN